MVSQLDMKFLEIRMNVMKDYVDHFVLVEATHTHSGKPKELFFNENKYVHFVCFAT